MNKFLTTTAIAALLAMPAYADDDTDIEQTVAALQGALNSISINFDGINIKQDATNAANLIDYDTEDLDDVTQSAVVGQLGFNNLLATGGMNGGSGPYGSVDDVRQNATNVVNSVTVGELNTLTQGLSSSDQTAINDIDADIDVTDTRQVGVNAANLASIADTGDAVDETTLQTVVYSGQDAANSIFANDGEIGDTRQAATNVMNSLDVAGSVGDGSGEVVQQIVYVASQSATSSMDAFGDLTDVRQAATNAANLATLTNVDGQVDQEFTFSTQIGANEMYSVVGSVDNARQAATNVANSISAEGGGLEIGSLDQDVYKSGQMAINSIDGVQIGSMNNVRQDATNAANLATLESMDGNVNQDIIGSGQLAANAAIGTAGVTGGITDLRQAATNVANSVTMNDLDSGDLVQYADYSGFLEGQAALNLISFGRGGLTDVKQAATNAVNLITMDDMEANTTLNQQVVGGAQIAANLSIWNNGLPLVSEGDVNNLTQTAVNAANLATLGNLPDTNGVLEISQSFSGLQGAGNGLYNADFATDVSQAATNVVNSISGL